MLRRRYLNHVYDSIFDSNRSSRAFISPIIRIIILATLILISTFLLSTFSNAKKFDLLELKSRFQGIHRQWYIGNGQRPIRYSPPFSVKTEDQSMRRARAAIVVLVRNSEMNQIISSIRSFEERFNKNYQYPIIFLNDEPFTLEFKILTSAATSGECTYSTIDSSDWDEPDHIDQERARKGREELIQARVPYGDSISYRKMCRFQSGYFWRQPILDSYEFYWRLEPHVRFSCDINYDVFLFMQDNKKKYGFTISIKEYAKTIPTLWKETKSFIDANPQHLAKPNLMEFISNDNGETYNLCHFWSNFEIASLDFWRSKAYRDYFEHLDKSGGFFYERWGDAPVHSIAAALFLKPEEIHFFQDIGYRHTPFQQCPKNRINDCSCNPNDKDSFEEDNYGCTKEFKAIVGWQDL